MHYSAALAAVVAVAPIVSGHGTGLPNIVGLDPKDTRARDLLSGIGARFTGVNEIASAKNKVKTQIVRRQDDRQCGAGIGNCPAGQCCSEAGCMFCLCYISRLFIDEFQTVEMIPTTASLPAVTTSMARLVQRT